MEAPPPVRKRGLFRTGGGTDAGLGIGRGRSRDPCEGLNCATAGRLLTDAPSSIHTTLLSRSETRSRGVSWVSAAGSAVWVAPSPSAVVTFLPLAEVPVRPAGSAGPVCLGMPNCSCCVMRTRCCAVSSPVACGGIMRTGSGLRRCPAGEPPQVAAGFPGHPGHHLALAPEPRRLQAGLRREDQLLCAPDRPCSGERSLVTGSGIGGPDTGFRRQRDQDQTPLGSGARA